MSAYIVDRAHIAAMVRLALEGPTDRPHGPGRSWDVTWYAADPRETAAAATDSADYFRRLESIRRTVTRENAQRVARLLMVANVASVAHRYPDDAPAELPGPRPAYWVEDAPAFDVVGARTFSAVHGLSMLAGFEYQACELPGWEGSEAGRFLDALQDALIRALPGYADGPWTVDDDEPEPPATPEPIQPDAEVVEAAKDRNTTIAAIRDALRRRTGRAWSVTGGRGTAWGWITVSSPPARRVGYGYLSDEDATALAAALNLERVHAQGVSIPASYGHRAEYVARALGKAPTTYGERYWD
jgi:hypothetical protein